MCNFCGSLNRFQAPLSPTPWSVERSHFAGMAREARVIDADGEPVTDYIALTDAEAIVAAMAVSGQGHGDENEEREGVSGGERAAAPWRSARTG